MDYRNAKRNANGSIDCEINHPKYGWIPFTCDKEDAAATFDVASLWDSLDKDPQTNDYIPPSDEELLAAATAEARSIRANLLETNVDPYVMNHLRWGDLTQEQQDAMTAYRQDLLDVTDQAGFPNDIVWPTFPW